jgi:hypothetical protein
LNGHPARRSCQTVVLMSSINSYTQSFVIEE